MARVRFAERVLGPGWREVRRWHAPCAEFPWVTVLCGCRLADGQTVLAAVREEEVVGVEVVPHPIVWVLSFAEEWTMAAKFVRRMVADAGRVMEAGHAATVEWAAAFPALWEYMTLEVWEDGGQRERSMLCLFVEDGRWKAALQDRAAGRSLWATGTTPTDVLTLLERSLQAGDADWRESKGQGGAGKRSGRR
jgi:hypothetical protein